MENFEALADNDLNPFRIHSHAEIARVLRNLLEKRQLLRMMIRGGAQSAVTSILEIDTDQGIVVLDVSADAALNQRLTGGGPLRFESVLDHISISFEADSLRLAQHENRPAFIIDFPQSLVRLQRREFFRIETPRLNPLHCVIQLPENNGRSKVTVRLENVSGGGVGIVDDNCRINPPVGTVYEDCRIELPNKTFLVVKLQIRNTREIALNDGRKVRRLGCQFVDMPRAMLTAVQRYISQLEREQNARRAMFE